MRVMSATPADNAPVRESLNQCLSYIIRGLPRGRVRRLALVALMAPILLVPAESAGQPGDQDPPASGFRWRNRPSFQFGELRIDLRLKVAHEWRAFDPDVEEADRDWRMRRGGINGEIGNHVEFEIERDLVSDGEWRDIFVNWGTYRQLEVRGGRFKVPFGREQLISASNIDFAERSLVSTVIPPARDEGVMVHGRFLRRGFTYEVGVFRDDGDNGAVDPDDQFAVDGTVEDIGPSFVARVTATPLRPLAQTFASLRVGLAYGTARLPEGLNSLRGETVFGTTDFFDRVYVKGRRTRVGVQAEYTPGPVSLAAEWMQAREQRKNQGLGDEDLSDVVTAGWYAAATWLVTGEDKADFNDPARPLFRGGFGSVELVGRYERLRFDSAEKIGPAFRNPRAEHILGNQDAVWTLGANWFLNRWLRVTVNAIRERIEDEPRTPLPGTSTFWSGVGRAQVVF